MTQVKVYVEEIPKYKVIKAVVDSDIARQIPEWLLPILDYDKVKARFGVEHIVVALDDVDAIVSSKEFAVLTKDIDREEWSKWFAKEKELPAWICKVLRDEAKRVLCGTKEEEEEEI